MPDERSGHVSYTSSRVGSGSKRANTEAEAAMHDKPVVDPVTSFLFTLVVRVAQHNCVVGVGNRRASKIPHLIASQSNSGPHSRLTQQDACALCWLTPLLLTPAASKLAPCVPFYPPMCVRERRAWRGDQTHGSVALLNVVCVCALCGPALLDDSVTCGERPMYVQKARITRQVENSSPQDRHQTAPLQHAAPASAKRTAPTDGAAAAGNSCWASLPRPGCAFSTTTRGRTTGCPSWQTVAR